MKSLSFQRYSVCASVAAAALLIAASSVAQPEEGGAPIQVDEANRLFREGREDFNAGRVKDAHRKYRTAWKLRKSPDVAANMAQAELELGQYDQAAMHFAYALAYLLPSTSREQRAALEQALVEVRAKVGQVKLRLRPSGANLTVDGALVDPVLIQTGVFVQPGGHVLGAAADGYAPAELTVAVAAGESIEVTLDLSPASSAAGAPRPPLTDMADDGTDEVEKPRSGRTPTLLTGGVLASVGYALGAYYLVRASRKDRDAETLREAAIADVGVGGCPDAATSGVCGELSDTLAQRDRSQNVAVGAFIAGGVFTVATVAATLAWPRRKPHEDVTVSVRFDGGPRRAGFTVGARF